MSRSGNRARGRVPSVSVIVATKDRPSLLRCALDSVAAQTLLRDDPIEVIVVNDGGADVSGVAVAAEALGEVIDEVVDGAAAGNLVVRLVSLPSTKGLAAARNRGLEIAQAGWVAFCDDDDVWLPHHLASVLEAARHRGAELAHSNCAVAQHRLSAHTAPTWLAAADPVVFALPWDRAMLHVTNTLPVAGVVCRNPAQMGVFFDTNAVVQEDWRMWLALAEKGWRGVHVDEPTAIYHRLPHTPGMTNQSGSELAALDRFIEGTRWVWQRWPARDDGITRCRSLVEHMYAVSRRRLLNGRALSHLRYEHSLEIVWQVLHGRIGDTEARSRLEDAVMGKRRPGDTGGAGVGRSDGDECAG